LKPNETINTYNNNNLIDGISFLLDGSMRDYIISDYIKRLINLFEI